MHHLFECFKTLDTFIQWDKHICVLRNTFNGVVLGDVFVGIWSVMYYVSPLIHHRFDCFKMLDTSRLQTKHSCVLRNTIA